jgi:hypothetical protein
MALASVVIFALVAGGLQPAQAHEVRPGYLELNALDAHAWDVLWKVPAKGNLRLGLYVRLPEGCEETEPVVRSVGTAQVERWRATCPDGLIGQSVRIDGLAATRTDVLARIKHLDGTTQTARLTPGDPVFQIARSPSQLEVATTYLSLGVEHILFGIDHLLFVLALLFLVGSWRQLVGTITAFTAAHSLTLAAAALGFVHVPQAPVEAAIALSIVFVTTEVINKAAGRPAQSTKRLAAPRSLPTSPGSSPSRSDCFTDSGSPGRCAKWVSPTTPSPPRWPASTWVSRRGSSSSSRPSSRSSPSCAGSALAARPTPGRLPRGSPAPRPTPSESPPPFG